MRRYSSALILVLTAIAVFFIGLSLGSEYIPLGRIISVLLGGGGGSAEIIILKIRLPRIMLAFFVGGGLSITGAVLQAMLMNPLAEPYILGISSGGAFGALLALMLGLSFFAVQIFSFAGAVGVIFLVFLLGRRFGELDPNMLLLSGVMVGAFFSAAMLMLIVFMRDSLRRAIFWLMGSLSAVSFERMYFLIPIVLAGLAVFLISAQKLNVLSFGADDAVSLGVNTARLKNALYILSGIIVGSIVSVTGIIGFVGLLVPHVCRLLLGYDNRKIIPASFIAGGSFLIIADTISRIIILPAEMPVGVVTAVIGAPVFIYLLKNRYRAF